jgi:hypothetical protein
MISFTPILKPIQETLFKKMGMLDKSSNSVPINEPATTGGEDPQENYMYTRSVMLRMVSMMTFNNKPIILSGGELLDNTLRSGMDIYGPKSGGRAEENPNLRPMAGIKDVSVEYAGGGMKIGSSRKTSISWTCWSWEELQKFKPFFLKHGRVVLIEFGWGFKGPDAPRFLDIIKENGELNRDLITGTDETSYNENKVGRTLQELIPDHIIAQKGHYDALLGTIQNFEFSVNESGGFDCTTDLVSLGVNTFNKMNEPESMKGSITNLPIAKPNPGFWPLSKDKDIIKGIQNPDPYYNFEAYMKSFESHLHLNAQHSKGTIAYLLGNDEPYCTWGWFEDNVLSRFAGQVNKESKKIVNEFRSIETEYDVSGLSIGQKPIQIKASRDIMAVDYSPEGWFFALGGDDPEAGADNEKNSQLIPNVKVYTDHEQGLNNVGFWARVKLVATISHTLGDFKMMFGPPFVQNGAVGTGKWAGDSNQGTNWEHYWRETFLGDKNAKVEANHSFYQGAYFRKFLNEDGDKGTLRNVYFGHKFLTDCFTNGADSIATGVESVWSKFSAAYGGIYDFGIHFDDKEGRLVIKDRGYAERTIRSMIDNKSTKENYIDATTREIGNPGLFVFPIWEKTSIVKSQNLNAKLPSRMQIAAMYGNNAPEADSKELSGYDDWGPISLGRMEQKEESLDEIKEGRENVLEDIINGTIEHPFRSAPDIRTETSTDVDVYVNPTYFGVGPKTTETIITRTFEEGGQFTFGSADANDQEDLQWVNGSSTNTTKVYEDNTDQNTNTGETETNTSNDRFGWGRGINEVLNDQLTAEFQSRLKAQYEKLDTTGMDEDDAKEAQENYEKETEKNLAESQDLLQERINLWTTKTQSGNSDAYNVLYTVDNDDWTSSSTAYIPRMQKNARYKRYPKLVPEYRGIMKSILKGDKNGLLKTSDPLVSIELEIEIDGTGGIFPGNAFHSSYLPSSYMNRVCFQVKGASHKIDSTGWTTTLVGQMRVAGNKLVTKEVVEPEVAVLPTSTSTQQTTEKIPLAGVTPIPDELPFNPDTDNVLTDGLGSGVPKSDEGMIIDSVDITNTAIDANAADLQKQALALELQIIDDNNKGYTQVGKLGDFDVSRGMSNIKLKSTTTSVEDVFKERLDGVNGYVAPAPVEKAWWDIF